MLNYNAVKIFRSKFAIKLARFYIRYFPLAIFKGFLWDRLNWRSTEYQVYSKFGAKFSGNSMDMVQGYIYYFGIWEPNLSSFVSRRLKNSINRTFVDVGANVGYFSLLAAKKMKSGNIIAIEAFPNIFKKLEKNIKINGVKNIRAVSYAASNIECDIEMFHGGITNEGMTTSVAGKFDVKPITVKGMPISKILTSAEIKSLLLIKIDVEGAEYAVLQGMKNLFPQLPQDAEVVMEITPAAYSSETINEIFLIFKVNGFFPYKIDNIYSPKYYFSHQNINRPKRIKILPTLQTDIVFSRQDTEYL